MTRRIIAAVLLALPAYPALAGDAGVKDVIERGLTRVQTAAGRYLENRNCFSCHHQLVVPVLAAAKERGFAVDPWVFWSQTEFTRESFRTKLDRIEKGEGIPGANTMAAYALFVLEAGGQVPEETTAGLVRFLTIRQAGDGSWPALADRPPSEGSSYPNAALALRGLKTYGLNDKSLTPELRKTVQASWDKGREWLLRQTPKSTEDKAFFLRALAEADAPSDAIKTATAALVKDQHFDGGWAQLPDMHSDAYATGIVLTALHRAGMAAGDPTYRIGTAYLLKTQNADGSWIVTTRSRPVQTFFDNGDPGGKSQFISTMATNWALLALLNSVDRAK